MYEVGEEKQLSVNPFEIRTTACAESKLKYFKPRPDWREILKCRLSRQLKLIFGVLALQEKSKASCHVFRLLIHYLSDKQTLTS